MKMQGTENITQAIKTQEKELHWATNDRTAGTIPVWESKKSAKAGVLQQISGSNEPEFAQELKSQQIENSDISKKETFGFGDLVDMINPLQHIPLINLAYREITGDQIKPIGKIVGGAVYGGPAGVIGGIVDAIVVEETGKDLASNALGLIENDTNSEDFELALLEQKPIKFNSEPIMKKAAQAYDRVQYADARTAGTIVRYT